MPDVHVQLLNTKGEDKDRNSFKKKISQDMLTCSLRF